MKLFFIIFLLSISVVFSQKVKSSSKISEKELVSKLAEAYKNQNYVDLYNLSIYTSKLYPKNNDYQFYLATAYNELNKNIDSAVYYYEISSKNKNFNFLSLYNLTFIYFNKIKDYEKAFTTASDALLLNYPDKKLTSQLNYICGYIAENVNKPQNAIFYYKSSYEDDPNNTYALYGKANCHLKLQQYQEASLEFDKLLNSSNKATENQYLSFLEKACEANSYLVGTGNYYLQLFKYAKEGYKKRPTKFIYYLGQYYNHIQDYQGFVLVFSDIYQYYPDADYAYQIAYGYMKLGNNNSAIDWLKVAARKGHQEAQNRLRKNNISW